MEKGPDAYRIPAPPRPDPVLQSRAGAGMPAPIQNFEGVPNVNHVQPADTSMAIGPDHVFQWVNLAFQVFDKAATRWRGPSTATRSSPTWAGTAPRSMAATSSRCTTSSPTGGS